jgi:hypothetical protein
MEEEFVLFLTIYEILCVWCRLEVQYIQKQEWRNADKKILMSDKFLSPGTTDWTHKEYEHKSGFHSEAFYD